MSINDLFEIEPQIRAYVCPRCLKKIKGDKHFDRCRTRFAKTILQILNHRIVHVTSESSEIEKLICERISQSSRACKKYRKAVLSKDLWLNNLHVFLLIQHEQVASYIVVDSKDRVLDFFTMPAHRGSGNMRFLLLTALESMNLRLDKVCFQKPLTDWQWGFLYKMSEETGLIFKTC